MDEVMSKAIAEGAQAGELSMHRRSSRSRLIREDRRLVGQRGKTINEIIARTGVKIDITDDGLHPHAVWKRWMVPNRMRCRKREMMDKAI